MQQLKMVWNKTKDTIIPEISCPEGYKIRSFDESDTDRDFWLDIVMHGLTDGRQGRDYVKSCLYDYGPTYDPEKTFFITAPDGIPCATITVICNHGAPLQGYIHMVACNPDHRGKGIGKLLNDIAVKTLIESGMETAYLTTDDFRIPAVRSYITAGFTPAPEQLEDPEMKTRWDAVYETIRNNIK